MKLFLSLTFLFVFLSQANATHILGGEIYYDSLGNDNYKITIVLYRNCNSGTQFDQTLGYTVFNMNNTQYNQYFITNPFISSVPPPNDPCIIPPSGLCTDRAIYVDTITLLQNPMGYYISYQRCCWANNIQNMISPGNNGLTLTCLIPSTVQTPILNQAARFNNEPPLLLCSDVELDFDHSATDPDGDSLRYYLCDPQNHPQGGGIDPQPEVVGPYLPIAWEVGFNAFQPFGASSTITLDSLTGQMTITPTIIGNFMTGVCVEEYRNGVLINLKNRTFNFQVLACDQVIPFAIASEIDGIPVNGGSSLVEDCGEQFVYFSRTNADSVLVIEIQVSGTATNGVDYPFIPNSLTMQPGTFNDTVSFTPYFDGLIEPTENLNVLFLYYDICTGTYDTLELNIDIIDYQLMTIYNPVDSVNICPDTPENAYLSTVVTSGIAPFSYFWHADPNEFYPDQANITVGPDHITEFVQPYYATVTDGCGKQIVSDTILVYNQCPIIVPNVVTINSDGVNEVFIIKNLKDYQTIKLRIYDRWGETLYESSDYQNDWAVTNKDGSPLMDGVYFYTAEVIDDIKYTYDDQEKTKYQAQGFFHVLGN